MRSVALAVIACAAISVRCNTADKSASEPRMAYGPDADAGETHRFAAGFVPRHAPNGGFGGGEDGLVDAQAGTGRRTPVVFLHGNGHDATDWSLPASGGGPSVLDAMRAGGYTDRELYGISYLSRAERATPSLNYHERRKADLIADFIEDVLRYSGSEQADVVGHSLGVTMGMHAIDRRELWGKIRRFVGISGAMQGIDSCLMAGFANPAVTTCGSQNLLYDDIFGFWPDGAAGVGNPRMGGGPSGFRNRPARWTQTAFYTIRAGKHDQIVCRSTPYPETCWLTSMFEGRDNVRSQVDVGAAGGDEVGREGEIERESEGVGHMRSMTNAGPILLQMLTSECRGRECCSSYQGACQL